MGIRSSRSQPCHYHRLEFFLIQRLLAQKPIGPADPLPIVVVLQHTDDQLAVVYSLATEVERLTIEEGSPAVILEVQTATERLQLELI